MKGNRIMKNRNTIFTTILLVCFASLPRAQAVITDPEGYFPGWNTAEGQSALFNLTTGLYNTAMGGVALYSNTTGNGNTAVGLNSLFHNTTGSGNTAMGAAALFYNTTGTGNTATGSAALRSNTGGYYNTANGYQALYFNNGYYNTAEGYRALYNNTSGLSNTAIGDRALANNTQGDDNVAIGSFALNTNTTGIGNTAIGRFTLENNTTGVGNTAIGYNAGLNVTTANRVICIGADVWGTNVSNSCYIGRIYGQSGGSQAVYVNSSGKLGQMVSSRRFKDDIKPIEQASEIIYDLKPVSFRYKPEVEPNRPLGFGLIAEEVEKVSPDLVTRSGDGQVSSVRYDGVNAMLLNEFLKEHKRVQELKSAVAKQEASIAEQRKDFEVAIAQQRQEMQILTAQLKEQAAQIRKVSVQVEATKFATGRICRGGPARQLASNDY
jgi:Chaperone of endosialidase